METPSRSSGVQGGEIRSRAPKTLEIYFRLQSLGTLSVSPAGIYIGEVLTSKSMDFAVLGLVFLEKSKALMGFIYLDTS